MIKELLLKIWAYNSIENLKINLPIKRLQIHKAKNISILLFTQILKQYTKLDQDTCIVFGIVYVPSGQFYDQRASLESMGIQLDRKSKDKLTNKTFTDWSKFAKTIT